MQSFKSTYQYSFSDSPEQPSSPEPIKYRANVPKSHLENEPPPILNEKLKHQRSNYPRSIKIPIQSHDGFADLSRMKRNFLRVTNFPNAVQPIPRTRSREKRASRFKANRSEPLNPRLPGPRENRWIPWRRVFLCKSMASPFPGRGGGAHDVISS